MNLPTFLTPAVLAVLTWGPALAQPDASRGAQAETRIRLATSQPLVALARLSDGSQWSRYVDVVVTLTACVES